MATGIINFLRMPQSFFLFINVGDNQYEGQLLGIQILPTMGDAEAYVDERYDSITKDGFSIVKVKTDLNALTDSFIELFSSRESIVDLQRYRVKKEEGSRVTYFQTFYVFEVKI